MRPVGGGRNEKTRDFSQENLPISFSDASASAGGGRLKRGENSDVPSETRRGATTGLASGEGVRLTFLTTFLAVGVRSTCAFAASPAHKARATTAKTRRKPAKRCVMVTKRRVPVGTRERRGKERRERGCGSARVKRRSLNCALRLVRCSSAGRSARRAHDNELLTALFFLREKSRSHVSRGNLRLVLPPPPSPRPALEHITSLRPPFEALTTYPTPSHPRFAFSSRWCCEIPGTQGVPVLPCPAGSARLKEVPLRNPNDDAPRQLGGVN